MNNGLLETLNTIMPMFEKMMEYTSSYDAKKYIETIKIAMDKKYNTFFICLVFDLMLSSFLKECRITLVDLVLERDKDAVDCVSLSKQILHVLKDSNYYQLKDESFSKMQLFLDEVYRKGTDIQKYFEKGEEMYKILDFHFNTIDDMELHQFYKGNTTDIKPLYMKHINCFRTMDEAVNMMNKIPVNFIALVGIKDENSREYGYYSYLIKNGTCLYALSDVNRSEGNFGVFTDSRSVYKDLMPYVHLREFQYVWYWEDMFGNKHPLNEDKYHIAPSNKNWNTFTLNELEDDEILLQYFMFDYVNNLLFKEKPVVKELTYSTQSIAITYKGKTINKQQLPIIASDMNKTEVDLPDFEKILNAIINKKEEEFLNGGKRSVFSPSPYSEGKVCERWWEIQEQAFELVRRKLKKEPLDYIMFELNKEHTVNAKGNHDKKLNNLSESHRNIVYGLSNNFFGTEEQYRKYSHGLMEANINRLIDEEYKNIIAEEKAKPYAKFLTYLLSAKFENLIIEKALLDALNDKTFSHLMERRYSEPSRWRTNGSWEDTGDNVWLDQRKIGWRAYEEAKGCILTGKKKCSYKVSLRINHIDEMKRIWEFVSEDNIPDYMKIHGNYTALSAGNIDKLLDYKIEKVFRNGNDEIFWISKSGLKAFCKKHAINFDTALSKIEKSNY